MSQKRIVKSFNTLQEELHDLIQIKGIEHCDTLKKSQELDELVVIKQIERMKERVK